MSLHYVADSTRLLNSLTDERKIQRLYPNSDTKRKDHAEMNYELLWETMQKWIMSYSEIYSPGFNPSKASASRVTDMGINSRFLWSSHIIDLKNGILVVAPGITDSVLELAGLMLVYCDWDRQQGDWHLLSQCASSWNCLSRSIPEAHLTCYWEMKPTRNKNIVRLISPFHHRLETTAQVGWASHTNN